jgi:hypothetical protein
MTATHRAQQTAPVPTASPSAGRSTAGLLQIRLSQWRTRVLLPRLAGLPTRLRCHRLRRSRRGSSRGRRRSARHRAIRSAATANPARLAADMPHSRTRSACEGFAVTGFSFGGPCARACAYALPGRVTRAGLISCLAPVDDPVAERGHGAAGEPLDRGTHGGRKDVLEGPALVGHRVPVLSGHQEPERSSGSLAVGRAEWEGVGESGLLEYALHALRISRAISSRR